MKSIIKIILMQDIEIDRLLQVKGWPVLQVHSRSTVQSNCFHTAVVRDIICTTLLAREFGADRETPYPPLSFHFPFHFSGGVAAAVI